jgi:hypothetical protein
MTRVRLSTGIGKGFLFFSLRHSVQTGFGAHPTFYPIGTGDFT